MPQEDARWRRQVVKEKEAAAVLLVLPRLCERNLTRSVTITASALSAKLPVERYSMCLSGKEPGESVFISLKKKFFTAGRMINSTVHTLSAATCRPLVGCNVNENVNNCPRWIKNLFVCHFRGGPGFFFFV